MPEQSWGQLAQNMVMNPLTQGGLGLMSGGGFDAMSRGLAGGQQMQKSQRELEQQRRSDEFMQGIGPDDPRFKGVNPSFMALAQGTGNPELLAKGLLGKQDQDAQLRMIQAQGGIHQGLEFAKMRYAKELGLDTLKNQIELARPLLGGNEGTQQGQQQASPPVPGARQAQDGNWYTPDPGRPGKYMMWRP